MVFPGHPSSPKWTWRDRLIAAGIFLGAFIIFYLSPVTYAGDSRYSLLLSQALITKGSFALDGYGIPIKDDLHHFGHTLVDGDIYQIEIDRGHPYYLFPPGSSILDIPFVIVGGWFGESALNADGQFDPAREEHFQRWLAPS